jgi:hypothetical protein
MKMSPKSVLFGVLALMVLQGCDCRPNNTGTRRGEARIVYFDESGTQVSGDDGIYDFGSVSMGKTVTKDLVVQNSGLGALVIQRWTKTSGDPAKVGTFVDEFGPVFEIKFSGETTVAAGETVAFPIEFTPPVNEQRLEVPHETVLVMQSANTEPDKDKAIITLKGKGVSGECDLPMVLDFGAVARGDTFSIDYVFRNQRPIETRGYLGDIESQQGAGIFTASAESPRGEFLIGANREKTARFTFAPTEARDYFATVRMRRAEGCPERSVRLIGTGVDAVLSWTPSTVDFAYAPPGTRVERTVTFANRSLRPVQLSALSIQDITFRVIETDQADLTKVTVPAGARDMATNNIVPGTVNVKMEFRPVVLGPRASALRATTDLTNSQPMINVPLRGVGGGPDIDVRPVPNLNFGRIAYFPNANPPSYANRKITVQNVGTRPTPPDPQANLKLGKRDANGNYVRPYWEVIPKNGAQASEICVGVFDTMTNTCTNDLPTAGAGRYDPVQGLEAGSSTSIVEIPVRIIPNGLGTREFDVKIFSNDPDEEEVTVSISANAVDLPACDVTITPISLAFGIVSPPAIRDLGFSIRNNKTAAGEICLISNLQLRPEAGTPTGMPPVFSLPGGEIAEIELQPGETRQFMVRAWPQGQLPPVPAQVVGRVGFNLAEPIQPQREVTMTATIANSCLTISPSSLDFGTVKKDCNSPNRNFQIYNSCSTDVVINSAAMGSAAGEPPGGPNCPGSAPCPEFFVVTNIPAGTRVMPGSATPVTFSLRYRPINFGPDTGAFVINVTQAGQNLDYVVALQGRGDMTGTNTDTFRQDSKPKADILLVIDDSCSMADKQTSLAQNMASFLQYATSNQVDFHIGVTNTELSGSTAARAGTLYTSPAGYKILRPTTPNLATEFAALVRVGTPGYDESCMDPATRALTAPNITDPTKNAGFLRQDAVLAVVCVTDARDQARNAPAFYLNQLLNIKGAQRTGQFTYNVIGPFLPSAPPGCAYDDPNDGRHEFMVSQTNGVKEEICTPNWATALENIGKNAFGYRTNFFLNSRPDLMSPTGIQVFIDGMPIPPVDPVFNSRIWEYDATNNSVNFEPLYVPEPGKTLTITYQAACIL